MFTFNLRVALLGLVTLSAAVTLPGCHSGKCCGDEGCAEKCEDKCTETKVEMNDLPPAVRATLEREAAGGKITEVEMCTKDGMTCYCAEIEMNGKERDICINADGTMKSK